MPELIQQIETILQKKLVHEPSRNGDPLANVMPVKDKTLCYSLDEEKQLVGLNLAYSGLTDAQWQKILPLPGLAAQLRGLNLIGNKLGTFSFPESPGLRKLEKLRLAENQIKDFSLPQGMEALTDLDLEENPLISPPPDVMALGNIEVLRWLKDKGKKPILEAKVMFIGDSNFGKTHLIEMLREKAITRKITTTHGIERGPMESAPSDLGPIRLNVWDLGGQQFMRSTHQFFFTERTLYVLVTVARRERKDLNHWLQLVHELGADAPVIVVINKTDLDEQDIDREPLRREYPNIKGVVRTIAFYDSEEKKIAALNTIQQLQSKIHEIVANKEIMPSVFVEQRPEWFTVKEELENMEKKMKKEFISYETYQQLEHIKDLSEEDQRLNLKQLSSLGTVVSFVDDPRLADTHVINPQWIMDGVYRLINDPNVKDKCRGRFNFEDLKRLLPAQRYPADKYDFLVELMEKFKLCYPVPRQKNTFLLPDLFADIEPEAVWSKENTGLRFRFNYKSFPPDIFMAQFIVARYADIVDEKRWRSGVVIRVERCEAIIRRAFSNDYIEIEVVGPLKQCRGFLHELLGVFRELHRPFENMEVEREIPYKTVWLNYDDLLTFEEDGKPYYHPTLREDIPVSEVLNGYAQPGEKDWQARIEDSLGRIEKGQETIQASILSLEELGQVNLQKIEAVLDKQNLSAQQQEDLFSAISAKLDQLTAKLPAHDPKVVAWKEASAKFKTEPEIKGKLKISIPLLALFGLDAGLLNIQFEKETNWNLKDVWGQIAQDMKEGHIFTKP